MSYTHIAFAALCGSTSGLHSEGNARHQASGESQDILGIVRHCGTAPLASRDSCGAWSAAFAFEAFSGALEAPYA